jgi:hypothetical protein
VTNLDLEDFGLTRADALSDAPTDDEKIEPLEFQMEYDHSMSEQSNSEDQ